MTLPLTGHQPDQSQKEEKERWKTARRAQTSPKTMDRSFREKEKQRKDVCAVYVYEPDVFMK